MRLSDFFWHASKVVVGFHIGRVLDDLVGQFDPPMIWSSPTMIPKNQTLIFLLNVMKVLVTSNLVKPIVDNRTTCVL